MLSPPPTNTSTLSEEAAEEFPLQESYETGSAVSTKEDFTTQPTNKSVRPKCFSLRRSITRPFVKTKETIKTLDKTRSTSAHVHLKSAQKSTKNSLEGQILHRVSFSPSTEEESQARDPLARFSRAETHCSFKATTRRASFNDSIGRGRQQIIRKGALAISWDQKGVHLATIKDDDVHRSQGKDKGRPARPRITKQQAIAVEKAAKSARAIEQIINAGASINIQSTEDLKAKRDRKTGGKLDKTKVQMIPAVSPQKVKNLGAALLDSATANDIIAQLRALQVKDMSTYSEHGQASTLDTNELNQVKQLAPRPVKVVCLNCREEEIEARKNQPTLALDIKKPEPTVAEETTAKKPAAMTLWDWTSWLIPQKEEAGTIQTEERDEAEVIAKTQHANIDIGVLDGISPISFILAPATTSAAFGATQSGAYDAIGSLSGIIVHAVNGEDEMHQVHPPLDRLSFLIHWWGFEMTIPTPSMAYLSRAQNISSSVMSILQTIAVSGGVPEILPFVRYFSTFVDMEFGAIKSQDHGHGVVVAATWLMPMALVPRPWDYPYSPVQKDSHTPSVSFMTPPLTTVPASEAFPFKASKTKRPLFHKKSAHHPKKSITYVPA